MILYKNQSQIDGIRKACVIASNSLVYIKPFIVPGVNTKHLNDLIDAFIRDAKAIPAPLNYNGFPESCCISINEVICHGIPSKNIIVKEGDIVSIDVAVKFEGFYGDTCKTFPVGEISEVAHYLLYHAQKALEIGIEAAKEGNRFGEIGKRIGEYTRKNGYSTITSYCGHGVGLYFHEPPRIVHNYVKDLPDNNCVIKRGHVFTIEPMIIHGKIIKSALDHKLGVDGWSAITINGNLSAQFEHTVSINTKTGVLEILTLPSL